MSHIHNQIRLILLDSTYKIIEETVIIKPDSFMILKNSIEKNLIKILKNCFKIYYYKAADKDYIEINENNYYLEAKEILFIINIPPKELDISEFSLNLNKLNLKEEEKSEIEEKFICQICIKKIKDKKPYFCYICQKIICEESLIDWNEKRKMQNLECNCPYCKEVKSFEKWRKINSFLDDRKNEVERMKILNHYDLNKNLNSIQIDKLKKENNELKKEIEKYKNLINSKNLNNIQINIEDNNNKEQENSNDFYLFKNDEKKDNNINQIKNINYNIEDNRKNNNTINMTKFGEDKNKNENNNIINFTKIGEYNNRNEINLIYYDEKGGDYQNILGEIFINNNKDNIRLFINNNEIKPLYYQYKLDKGNNYVKIIVKKKLTNLMNMFYKCSTLKDIEELSKLDTRDVNDFSFLFFGCKLLINLKPLEYWDVSKGTNFGSMLNGCELLTNIESLENWNVSKGTNFGSLFNGCKLLKNIKALERWDISNNTNFSSMFKNCLSLVNINPLESWNISKGTNFTSIFNGCKSLVNIKALENWNMSNNTNFGNMFRDCKSLTNINALENWNVSNGTNFCDMFA